MNKNTRKNKKEKKVKSGTNKVVSQNASRNMQQIVLINKNEDGTKFSVTKHVPIDSKERFAPYLAHQRSGEFKMMPTRWEYKEK